MVWYWRIGLLALSLVVLGGCGGFGAPKPAAGPVEARSAAAQGKLVEVEGPITVRAFDKDRTVQPDSDETFDFLVVNTTDKDLAVRFALEHSDGQRWRTSLCVEKQCLLGDGTEPSVTDPVTLPPYFEQPFQAHLFVDKAAQPGHQSTLTLRVVPLVEAAAPRSVTLSALVSQP
jgi:hypothetical protein